ncbi:VOC family protein [Nonomuraea sp. NPDC050556]|uniref:VOC family protein n=1 Tax=Nonomuraea sp. NPDC050556 TaxID=3364369 RepID=UPI00378F53A6
MTQKATFIATTIDCSDPKRMAEFYSAVTGWPIQVAEEEYSAVGDGTHALYFGRVPGRKPVAWPSDDKQFHLDFRVEDVDKAVEEYIALGATKPEFQPGVDMGGWVVMQDPEGHLFDVCPPQSS